MYTQLNQYHVVMEVAPQFWQNPDGARTTSTSIQHRRQQVPLSAVHPLTRRPPRRSPSITRANFPSVTLSFNLAPGVALGDAVDAIDAGRSAKSACPRRIHGSFPGHRAGVPGLARQRAAPDRRRAARRLHRAGHALRELHPSDHDSLDAALGRRRRAAGAAALPHRAERHRADRHHPADRHRQEERHHDDRLRARGRARRRQIAATTRSTRPACCASARS